VRKTVNPNLTHFYYYNDLGRRFGCRERVKDGEIKRVRVVSYTHVENPTAAEATAAAEAAAATVYI